MEKRLNMIGSRGSDNDPVVNGLIE